MRCMCVPGLEKKLCVSDLHFTLQSIRVSNLLFNAFHILKNYLNQIHILNKNLSKRQIDNIK